jgi:hypothetical protein
MEIRAESRKSKYSRYLGSGYKRLEGIDVGIGTLEELSIKSKSIYFSINNVSNLFLHS